MSVYFYSCSPGHRKTVVGEGMPLIDTPNKRGDLVVEFNITFPPALNPEQKSIIRQALV